ncbi:MAG: hypothetical protein WEB60_13620 [Terrimicrobiaceae bacterium]
MGSSLATLISRFWLGPVLVLVCGIHLLAAAFTIDRSNQDSVASDQGAEMWLASLAREDAFPQTTDGVRHPLFSWLAQKTFSEDKALFFARGKWFNTILVVGFLCVFGLTVHRWLGPLATTNLLLLSSLGILLVRGTYFQPEPLFYLLFFACLVMAWEILAGATWKIYPLFGITCGLAYLAKPSLLPFLVAFAFAVGVKIFATLCLSKPPARDGAIPKKIRRTALEKPVPPRQRAGLSDILPDTAQVAGALLGILAFAVIIAPLGFYSQKHFGKPFFSYPQYWMWMDDFKSEAWPWQDKHPGRAQLEAIPPGELPSMTWYFERHTPAEALTRLTDGTTLVLTKFFFPESKRPASAFFWKSHQPKKPWEQPLVHRGLYLIALGLLLAALVFLARKSLPPLSATHVAIATFLLACFFGYAKLYGWYWPIGRGDRFMGSLWIPTVFLLIAGCAFLRPLAGQLSHRLYLGTHALILLSLLLQAASLLNFFFQGGSLVTRN